MVILHEKYVQGEEVTIFYVVCDGIIYLYAMADKKVVKISDKLPPLPESYIFPSKYVLRYTEEADQKAKALFKSIDILNGILFIQAIVKNNEFIFYEMGFRLTPTFEYHLVEKFSDVNTLEMMIRFSITAKMCNKDVLCNINPNFDGYACNLIFIAYPGKICGISGLKEVREYAGVVEIIPAYYEGDLIPESALGTLKQVVLRVLIVAKTRSELEKLIIKIRSSIKIYSDSDPNMGISECIFDVL